MRLKFILLFYSLGCSHSIAQHRRKGHGGTLEVESEEGMGTTFITRLPSKQPFI